MIAFSVAEQAPKRPLHTIFDGRACARSTWRLQVHNTLVSSFQADVSATLHAMGVAHSIEYMTEARPSAGGPCQCWDPGHTLDGWTCACTPGPDSPQGCLS